MIDINGTRYHLLLGATDWLACSSEGGKRRWDYDQSREAVCLQAEIYAFKQRGPAASPLKPEQRPGAARDVFGYWYWLDGDAGRIFTRRALAAPVQRLFPPEESACRPTPRPGVFRAAPAAQPSAPEKLAGLAATGDGHLVAGSPATGSLLVFDLHALDGGFVRVALPPPPGGGQTEPFDLAALPDGGLLVLDRTHRLVWRLDSAFRPIPARPATTGELLAFQPRSGPPRYRQQPPPAQPIDLLDTPTFPPGERVADPIAVEALPDGSFWLLDRRAPGAASVVWRYSPDQSFAPQRVELKTANLLEPGADDLDLLQIEAHDLAYVPAATSRQAGMLFVADISGNQAYAVRVELDGSLTLRIERAYYPLRGYSGTALVAVWPDGEAYYAQGERWLPIKALPQLKYEAQADLILPALDGRDPGCIWHRLTVDACIPPETELLVEARAADTAEELRWQGWQPQPKLYRRPMGSELPYTSLWSAGDLDRPGTGTWELLFQETCGRYAQLRLTLLGNGRSTPVIRALRAYYPRFSYLTRYLPGIYQQDPVSMQFVENFLANPEGIFTTLEGLVAQAQYLLDVRTVPAELVDWLANWLGLALEPGWTDYQRRLLLGHAPYFFQRRGTLPGLMQAILLAVAPELGPAIFQDDIDQFCPTIRIVERFLTRTQPGVAIGDPTEPELATTDDVRQDAQARAHRFTVMLPTSLDPEIRRLVERIVDLEKPAHTSFTIKQFWALFRVGEARVGLDTVLGQGSRFETFRLGQTALAEGKLGEAYPFTLTTRTVIAR